MMMYELGKRFTGNKLAKLTTIYKQIVDGKQAYKFYSSYDECGYVYPGYSLNDALRAYEVDTRWQGFAEIHYFTCDLEIKEEYERISPF